MEKSKPESIPSPITSSSSSSTPQYEIFLNFKAEDDIINKFVNPLKDSLDNRGIRISTNKVDLHTGQSFGTVEPLKVIESSKYAVIIFSKNYAYSTWCLNELVKIIECKDKFGLIVIPIFYDVDPEDVFNQRNSFAFAFSYHQMFFKDNIDKVISWRKALRQVSNLPGRDLHGRSKRYCVENIVEEISSKLSPKALPSVVGTRIRVVKIMKFLHTEPNEVRFIGIWDARHGRDREYIASALLEEWHTDFEELCYLPCLRLRKDQTTESLQEYLVTQVLKSRCTHISDIHEGIKIIKDSFQSKKVIVLINDADDIARLKALVGECDWFGAGSRIVITSGDEQLLKEMVHHSYKVRQLSKTEAMGTLDLSSTFYINDTYYQLSIHNWTGIMEKDAADGTTSTNSEVGKIDAFCSEIDVEILVVKYTWEIANFCYIFPTKYSIARDALIWLWEGVGLIEAESDEEIERIGFSYIDHLIKLEFLKRSGYDYFTEQFYYKVINGSSINPRCQRGLDATNVPNPSQLEHLSLVCVGNDKSSYTALKSVVN